MWDRRGQENRNVRRNFETSPTLQVKAFKNLYSVRPLGDEQWLARNGPKKRLFFVTSSTSLKQKLKL